MEVENLNWSILDRLRSGFLDGSSARGPYWQSLEDLQQYDLTFGERIGWKWDAVLRELTARGWLKARSENPSESRAETFSVLDWGCGSGVAGRRVVDQLGAENVSRLSVWDHSPRAREFAAARARSKFPDLAVEMGHADSAADILVISHVLNELDAPGREQLVRTVRQSRFVIWVEPGTHAVSRDLIGFREKLRDEFRVVAPCTHQQICGLLAPQNAPHWCHTFAAPPSSIYADSDWVKFGQRAGIDLRSLPYAFLVLEKLIPSPSPTIHENLVSDRSAERVLGDPRLFKGYAKVLSCDAEGVRELTLQKRTDPALYKSLKRFSGIPVYRWTLDQDQVETGQQSFFENSEEA